MLPAVGSLSGGQPVGWPTDGRAGGVPDPRAAGPDMIQIGNDGGLLPQVALLPATPVGFTVRPPTEKDSLMGVGLAIVGISGKALFLGPGERADVIVDFSQVPSGTKLILYNDAPAPAPSGDSRVDYYTGDPDLSAIGGAEHRRRLRPQHAHDPAVPGRRRRLAGLRPRAAAAGAAGRVRSLPGPRPRPHGRLRRRVRTESSPDSPLQEGGTVTFAPLDRGYELTLPVQGKIVTELFDPTYGRETATLGVEAPLSASGIRTSVPYSAIDPATEFVVGADRAAAPRVGDGTQLWRITHDGTVSHSIHFGGMDVQVLERAQRDGVARAPDPGELGWKNTLRMDPLESCLIAIRPVLPRLPYKLDASRRLLDVTRPPGATGGFTELDPVTAAPKTVVNGPADYSWEAYWGIHLQGGEESHVARPLVIQGSPGAPEALTATAGDGPVVTLTWSGSIFPPDAIAYVVERADDESFRKGRTSFEAAADAESLTDDSAPAGRTSFYRVRAEGEAGFSPWSAPAEVAVP